MHPAGEEKQDGGGKEKGKKKPRRHVVYVEFRNVAREDRVGPNESSRARSLRALDLFSFLPPRKVSGDITARTAGLASNAFSLTRGIRIRAHARARARVCGTNVHTLLAAWNSSDNERRTDRPLVDRSKYKLQENV